MKILLLGHAASVPILEAIGRTIPLELSCVIRWLADEGTRTEADEIPSHVLSHKTAVELIGDANLVIFEISKPSIDIGYLIAYALSSSHTVVCVHSVESEIDPVILGNPHPRLTIYQYATSEDAANLVREFITAYRGQAHAH